MGLLPAFRSNLLNRLRLGIPPPSFLKRPAGRVYKNSEKSVKVRHLASRNFARVPQAENQADQHCQSPPISQQYVCQCIGADCFTRGRAKFSMCTKQSIGCSERLTRGDHDHRPIHQSRFDRYSNQLGCHCFAVLFDLSVCAGSRAYLLAQWGYVGQYLQYKAIT